MTNIIITADWHLRSARPRCRLDADWIETQRNVLKQISTYAKQYEADVLVIGDIFHSVNETTNEIIGLIQKFAESLISVDASLYVLAGNHDLPYHNLDNIEKSAFNVLLRSVNIFPLCDFTRLGGLSNISAANFGDQDADKKYIFKHVLCFPESDNIERIPTAVKPSMLFEQFPSAKVIFTGDYHHAFLNKVGKKVLCNPGCITRQAADLIGYVPIVYLCSYDKGSIGYDNFSILTLDDGADFVTDAYITTEDERQERLSAFVEKIRDKRELSFDFVENVHIRMRENKFEPQVERAIYDLLGE